MKYEELTPEEKEYYENRLIEKAKRFWVEMYGTKQTTEIEKVRLLSRQGKIQDTFQHDIMVNYFRKQGFWRDGKTTHREREKQLILKKTEFGRKIAKLQDTQIRNIDKTQEELGKKKEKLLKIPLQLKEQYKVEKHKILAKLQQELEDFYGRAENDIKIDVDEIYQDFISSVRSKQEQLVNTAKQDLENLQRHAKQRIRTEVEVYGAELEVELSVIDDKKDIDDIIKQYHEEVRIINQELNELRGTDGIVPEAKIPMLEKKSKISIDEEIWLCPICRENKELSYKDRNRNFINKGGLHGHIKSIHGDEALVKFKQERYGIPEEVSAG